MIKNIIFDLDDTIIKYEDRYALYYKDVLKKLGYDENEFMSIYQIIDKYEATLTKDDFFYSKEKLLEVINHGLGKDYKIELINEINNSIAKNWLGDILISEDVMNYLNNKYECYIFTNWFQETQEKRIENIGYKKYFKGIYGADKYGSKPFKEAFKNILKKIDTKPEECIMIGDNKYTDIYGASSVGIKTILFDWNGHKSEKDVNVSGYKIVNNCNEIKEIL